MDARGWTTGLMLSLGGIFLGASPPAKAAEKSIPLPTTLPVTGMKGLPEDHSRVTGLALTVEDAGSPTFSMLTTADGTIGALRGSTQKPGWLTPTSVVFGCVSTGPGMKLAAQHVNEVTNTLTFAAKGRDALRVTVTRLSPAVLLESDSAKVELFGLEQKALNAGAPGTVPLPAGTIKPLRWATPDANGKIVTGVFGAQPLPEMPFRDWENRFVRAESLAPEQPAQPPVTRLDKTWLLLWYGHDSAWVSTKVPGVLMWNMFYPSQPWRMNTAFQADVPLLLVFENAPRSVQLSEDGRSARLLVLSPRIIRSLRCHKDLRVVAG